MFRKRPGLTRFGLGPLGACRSGGLTARASAYDLFALPAALPPSVRTSCFQQLSQPNPSDQEATWYGLPSFSACSFSLRYS